MALSKAPNSHTHSSQSVNGYGIAFRNGALVSCPSVDESINSNNNAQQTKQKRDESSQSRRMVPRYTRLKSIAFMTAMLIVFSGFFQSLSNVEETRSAPMNSKETTSVAEVMMEILELPVHTNSSIHDDVLLIQHDPAQRAIMVHLRPDGRCPHPSLRGRLSGPALVALDYWKYSKNDQNNIGDIP